MALSAVGELLRVRIGLDPAVAGPGLIGRAVRSRMKAKGIAPADEDRYLSLLQRSHLEFEALAEEVLVPESWFFRDEQPFALLADRFGNALLADPGRPPLRVLSVPCASGEEPYSVAMTLLDRDIPRERFQVTGIDLSRRSLDTAREGVYTDNAFRSRDLSFRDRHFRRTDRGYEIATRVKAAVEFRRGNVVDPVFLKDEPPFDAVFCRNLLIYLEASARRTALAHLDRLLAPGGVLFVGHAEHLGVLSPVFRPAGETYVFAFERVTGSPTASPLKPGPTAAPGPVKAPKGGTHTPARALPVRPQPPAPPARIAAGPEGAGSARGNDTPPPGWALGEASRLADSGRHAEAADLCEAEIRAHGPTAAAYYLLGLVRSAAGQGGHAERCFEKAVYLDPRHEEALMALSAAARRRGELEAADNYLRRAGRAAGESTPR